MSLINTLNLSLHLARQRCLQPMFIARHFAVGRWFGVMVFENVFLLIIMILYSSCCQKIEKIG